MFYGVALMTNCDGSCNWRDTYRPYWLKKLAI